MSEVSALISRCYLYCTAVVYTAAVQMLGGDSAKAVSRTPDIMADAAYAILTKDSRQFTGNFCIDDEVLRRQGVTDFDKYKCVQGESIHFSFSSRCCLMPIFLLTLTLYPIYM